MKGKGSRGAPRAVQAVVLLLLASGCYHDTNQGDCTCTIPGSNLRFVSVQDVDCERIAAQSRSTLDGAIGQCVPPYLGGPCSQVAADPSLIQACTFHSYGRGLESAAGPLPLP